MKGKKMNISRRELMKLGLGALAVSALPLDLRAACPKSIPIALQLYSIREDCQKNLPAMIEAVAKMGYQGVELMAGNFGADAKEFRKLIDANGLKCAGTHTPKESLDDANIAKTADYMAEIGGKYLIVPWLNADSKDGWLAYAEWLTSRVEILKKYGMAVGFHNHAHEMTKTFDGKCAWDIIFENTPKEVIHQLDVGHCVHAGADPVPFIKKYAGRSKVNHIAEFGGGGIIGKGQVKWNEVLPALANEGGAEWFIIECENKETPVQDAADCLKGLKALV
ncbi:MAG: sugar phosphate isomerase/epimerase [Planctomycetaceae bacterium]|nr:sugar phosphate isomerase/epimerase [Planctomycetaceae bacterium]